MELKSRFTLSLIFLTIAQAGNAFPSMCSRGPCSFNGFTLGLGVGATTFMTDINNTASVGSASLDPTNDIYKYGAMGRLFAGYGNVFDNHAYLGVELGLNFLGADETSITNVSSTSQSFIATSSSFPVFSSVLSYNNSLNTKTKVTRNSVEPVLDLKLGFLVTPTALVFARGGVAYNELKIKTNSSYNVTATTTPLSGNGVASSVSTSSSLSTTKKKDVFSWRVGAGTEVMVTPNFSIGADYVYTFYQNVKGTGSGAGNDVSCDVLEGCAIDSVNFSHSSKSASNDQQVTASLIYHFD